MVRGGRQAGGLGSEGITPGTIRTVWGGGLLQNHQTIAEAPGTSICTREGTPGANVLYCVTPTPGRGPAPGPSAAAVGTLLGPEVPGPSAECAGPVLVPLRGEGRPGQRPAHLKTGRVE